MRPIPDGGDDGDDRACKQQVGDGPAVSRHQHTDRNIDCGQDKEEAKGLLGPEAQARRDGEPDGVAARLKAVGFEQQREGQGDVGHQRIIEKGIVQQPGIEVIADRKQRRQDADGNTASVS